MQNTICNFTILNVFLHRLLVILVNIVIIKGNPKSYKILT